MFYSKLNSSSSAVAYIKFFLMVIVKQIDELTELKVCLHEIYMYFSIRNCLLYTAINSALSLSLLAFINYCLLFLNQGEGSHYTSEFRKKSFCLNPIFSRECLGDRLCCWASVHEKYIKVLSSAISLKQQLGHYNLADTSDACAWFYVWVCLIHPNPSMGKLLKFLKLFLLVLRTCIYCLLSQTRFCGR